MDNNNQSSPSPPADLSLFLTLLKHFASQSAPARQLAPLTRLGSFAGGPLGLATQLPLLEASVYGDAPATDFIIGKQGAGSTPTARVGKAFDTFRYYPTWHALAAAKARGVVLARLEPQWVLFGPS